jgi:uncharacterized protein YbjT (DUF2867 family)
MMPTPNILICGATGQVGRALTRALTDRGVAWIGASRRPPREGVWRKLDFADPSTLAPALEGIERVFLASADHPEQDRLELAMLAACRSAGVKHVVKLSAQSAGLEPPVSFGRLHRRVELALVDSGIAWTSLRPTFFMQSLRFFAADVAKGRLIAPCRSGAVAMVDADDVAEVAAAVLVDPAAHEGAIHVLTGARALSFAEVAQRLAIRVGRPVRHVSPPAWFARLVLPFVSGMPRWQSDLVVELMQALAVGGQSSPTSTITTILARPAGDLDAVLDRDPARWRPR